MVGENRSWNNLYDADVFLSRNKPHPADIYNYVMAVKLSLKLIFNPTRRNEANVATDGMLF